MAYEWSGAPARPDFADLTIAVLGLSGARREVAEATRWLDPEDRLLLALWWLEACGHLTRSDLVAALAEPPRRVAARIRRVRAQLTVARHAVRALADQPCCAALAALAGRWDGTTTPLWRQRFGRHVRECPRCAPLAGTLPEPEHLLAGLPLVAPRQ